LTLWAAGFVSMCKGQPRAEVRSSYSDLNKLLGDCLKLILKNIESEEERQRSISEEQLERQTASAGHDPRDLMRRNVRINTVGGHETGRE
jgi:hypothetical protein